MVPTPSRHVRIDHASAVYAATRAARETGRAAGLPDVLTERAAVVTSELAGNLDKHAVNGSVVVQRATTGLGIDVLAADDGPGMTDLEHWLLDGNTTTATLGTGLGAVKRMATVFRIRSAPGSGTIAAARVLAPGTPAGRAAAMAHFCLPREGESVCGDAVAIAETSGSQTAVVADGLGHGPDAAEAADVALSVFAQNPDRPLAHQIASMHRALRATRGAAIALARITPRRLEFCGIGNVIGTTLNGRSRPRAAAQHPGNRRVHLAGRPGPAGAPRRRRRRRPAHRRNRPRLADRRRPRCGAARRRAAAGGRTGPPPPQPARRRRRDRPAPRPDHLMHPGLARIRRDLRTACGDAGVPAGDRARLVLAATVLAEPAVEAGQEILVETTTAERRLAVTLRLAAPVGQARRNEPAVAARRRGRRDPHLAPRHGSCPAPRTGRRRRGHPRGDARADRPRRRPRPGTAGPQARTRRNQQRRARDVRRARTTRRTAPPRARAHLPRAGGRAAPAAAGGAGVGAGGAATPRPTRIPRPAATSTTGSSCPTATCT